MNDFKNNFKHLQMPKTKSEPQIDYAKPEVPRMLTIKEVAEATKLSQYCVRKLCLEGKVVHIRSGSKYFINYGKFLEYLNSSK